MSDEQRAAIRAAIHAYQWGECARSDFLTRLYATGAQPHTIARILRQLQATPPAPLPATCVTPARVV